MNLYSNSFRLEANLIKLVNTHFGTKLLENNANKIDFNEEPLASSQVINNSQQTLENSGYLKEPVSNYDYIQDPLNAFEDNVILNVLGEPTLQSLGLGSFYWPTGWVQLIIEFFHTSVGLPWIESIAIFTVILRLAMFPITIKTQKNAVKMKKIGPIQAKLSDRMSQAKMSGNKSELERATYEYVEFLKINKIGIGTIFSPFLQFPFVLSAFFGIRGMCTLPVESLQTSGILWFQDLTLADPYFILPLFATASIFAVVHKGIDTGVSASSLTPSMKGFMYLMSLISLPFFMFLPSGTMIYVCTTNLVSLSLAYLLSYDRIKIALGIPILRPSELLQLKIATKEQKSFMEGFKSQFENEKIVDDFKRREEFKQRIEYLKKREAEKMQTKVDDQVKKIKQNNN